MPPDPDPRFRLDAFDCTTFVETALALATSPEPNEVRNALDRIRYQNKPYQFRNRRHLATSQWVPGLANAGLVEDVTESLAGSGTKWIALELDQKRWRRRRVAKTLKLDANEVPNGLFRLPYLPLRVAKRMIRKIPAGLVLNVVRADVPSAPDVITHQGLIVVRGKKRYVRHASTYAKKVIDEPLTRMLRRYAKPKKWPIVGINLLRILDPRPVQGGEPLP